MQPTVDEVCYSRTTNDEQHTANMPHESERDFGTHMNWAHSAHGDCTRTESMSDESERDFRTSSNRAHNATHSARGVYIYIPYTWLNRCTSHRYADPRLAETQEEM